MPKISVIIPAYNQANYIGQAIESVLTQTYKDVEIIVVDDCSTDDIKKGLKDFNGKIRYARHEKNKGLPASRNTGIQMSTGEYIAFLDSDDIFLPAKLELQSKYLDSRQDMALVYSWCNLIDSEGNLLPEKGKFSKEGNLYLDLLTGNQFPVHAFLIRRKCLDGVGYFDESLKAAEDWDLWLRIAKYGYKFGCIPECLVSYRVHNKSMRNAGQFMETNMSNLLAKIFNGDNLSPEIAEKKNTAYFLMHLECCGIYFAENNVKAACDQFLYAFRYKPEALFDYKTIYLFSNFYTARGHRTEGGVFKNILAIKKAYETCLQYIERSNIIKDSYKRKKSYSALYQALSMISYCSRDMKQSRKYGFEALKHQPSLVFNVIFSFMLLKSLLGTSIINKASIAKNKVLSYNKNINSKKVLYVLDIFPAVSETFIINEILELERRGINVLVLARKKGDSQAHGLLNGLKAEVIYLPDAHALENQKLIFVHLKTALLNPVNYIKTFFFALKKRNKGLFWFFKVACFYADIARGHRFSNIHSHFASVASCYAMLIGKLLNKPFTFTIHGWYDLYEAPPKDLNERAIAAKKVITISDYNKRYLINKFGIPAEKIDVIHCGVDLNYFGKKIASAPAAPRNDSEKLILSVARLHPVKGLDTLIRACTILAQKNSNFKCWIVGEGEERGNLERLIAELKLNDHITLTGKKRLEEVRECYNKASVFVLPSRHETMGVSTMEAMACGVPVISTNVYGIPELVDNSINGYMFSPGDDKQLAGFLEELLEDESKNRQMGKMGREKIEKEFNLAKEADKLVNIWYGGNKKEGARRC